MTYWNNINENENGNENENENENGNENGNEDGEDGGFATIFFKTINIYKHFKHLRL